MTSAGLQVKVPDEAAILTKKLLEEDPLLVAIRERKAVSLAHFTKGLKSKDIDFSSETTQTRLGFALASTLLEEQKGEALTLAKVDRSLGCGCDAVN